MLRGRARRRPARCSASAAACSCSPCSAAARCTSTCPTTWASPTSSRRRRTSRATRWRSCRGPCSRALVGPGSLEVNSTHHQAVCRPGSGVTVSGRAPDGVVEAIELDGPPFALGVQWHPEALASRRSAPGRHPAGARPGRRGAAPVSRPPAGARRAPGSTRAAGAGLLADLEALAAAGARGWAVATALTAQGPRRRARRPSRPRRRCSWPRWTRCSRAGGSAPGAREDRHARERRQRRGAGGAVRGAPAREGAARRRPGARRLLRPLAPRRRRTPGRRSSRSSPAPRSPPPTGRSWRPSPAAPLGSEEEAVRAARELPSRAVLVKGGHRAGEPVDLLVRGRTVVRIRRPAPAGRGPRHRLPARLGDRRASWPAGCRSRTSVRRAKRVVERYLDAAARRRVLAQGATASGAAPAPGRRPARGPPPVASGPGPVSWPRRAFALRGPRRFPGRAAAHGRRP